MLTTVAVWGVRTETHITGQHQIRKHSSQFLHCLNSRSVVSVSPRASLILKPNTLHQDLYKRYKIPAMQRKCLTFVILAGTPKISTHFKPFSTRGRSIPSSLLTPYLLPKTRMCYYMSHIIYVTGNVIYDKRLWLRRKRVFRELFVQLDVMKIMKLNLNQLTPSRCVFLFSEYF